MNDPTTEPTTEPMTEPTTKPAAEVRTARPAGLEFAFRQIATFAVALLGAGIVADQLRPAELTDRGLATSPFLWAIVVWAAVVLINEVAFDRSQMHRLQLPLYVGAGAGVIVLVIGMVGGSGSTSARFPYALFNALGASIFWWGLASLVALLTYWARTPD